MNRRTFFSTFFLLSIFLCSFFQLNLWAQTASREEVRLWPGLAPGETAERPNQILGSNPEHFSNVTVPTVTVYLPEKRTSDACLLIFPGGGYQVLMGDYEGSEIAEYWNSKGVAAAVVKYRVPRRPNVSKHCAAWQDAQRAVRWVRANAERLQINPEKIGCTGFSAGGHLTLMTALCGESRAYEPVDELDKMPAHVNFAIPIYPAYVLEDGKNGANTGKGNDSELVSDFAFDAKTPPMCFIHGDADVYSPMASVAVYHKLRTMNIPAELHIYALKKHGLLNIQKGQDHADTWKDRTYDWFVKMEKSGWK